MMTLEERRDTNPLCPFCEKPQHTIHFRSIKSLLGRRYVYFCAGCRKILGLSHRKGFWLG
ncbi:MAG: hypothetical protein AAGF72_19345 [Pseudomonadota bacterium]